jgi:glycine reductase
MARARVVHYVNQFFAGVGGESEASTEPYFVQGPVGPGKPLDAILGDQADIVLTAACGDDFFAEQTEKALDILLDRVRDARPNLFLAGPAFNSGRYGYACGVLGQRVARELSVPVVSGMAPENPGLEYRREAYIVRTADNVRGMKDAIEAMARLGLRLLRGEEPGAPEGEGYFPRGYRKNIRVERKGTERALSMLLAKIRGDAFETELVMPRFDRVPPAPPVGDPAKATVALVTTGGLVPKGNPDRLESTMATRFGRYAVEGVEDLSPADYEGNHGGYSTAYVNEDPDRLVPLDVLRDLEREGRVGKVHEAFYTMAGCSTYYEAGARIGAEIARELKESDVDAALITAT